MYPVGVRTDKGEVYSTNSDLPYCMTKKYILKEAASPYYELDCATAAGVISVYDTYTDNTPMQPTYAPAPVTPLPSANPAPSTQYQVCHVS